MKQADPERQILHDLIFMRNLKYSNSLKQRVLMVKRGWGMLERSRCQFEYTNFSTARWVSSGSTVQHRTYCYNTILCSENFDKREDLALCSYPKESKNKGVGRNFWRWYIDSWPWLWWWFQECILISNLTKLYILNIYSSLYVNHNKVAFKKQTVPSLSLKMCLKWKCYKMEWIEYWT